MYGMISVNKYVYTYLARGGKKKLDRNTGKKI